ncbi:helix-turn-helix transcriptional regulator [Scandinavium sp. NPDC088450]|uniref:helix-turn-helix transcriptional regulator n=1 Tax=Scandinavium sp. NPDC088450 TaxID=3364514 RepID=UPI0038507871
MSRPDKQQEIRQTIEHLRQQNLSSEQSERLIPEGVELKKNENRQRATSEVPHINAIERTELIRSITFQVITGQVSQGEALRKLRIEILSLKQEKYAELVSVSRKTISDIENNKGNYSLEVMNRVFKPFGLKMGLIPVSASLLETLMTKNPAETK